MVLEVNVMKLSKWLRKHESSWKPEFELLTEGESQ